MKSIYKSILISALLLFVITGSKAQWIQTNGPFGGYVYDFAFIDTLVFSANNGALFRSTVNGSSWSYIGLSGSTFIEGAENGSGGMNLYAAPPGGGVAVSTDSGNTWNSINNGLPNLNVNCITVTPNGSGGSTLFVGLGYGGICRSDNDGATWNPIGPLSVFVYDIAIEDSIILAATLSGMVMSDDYGVTWNFVGMPSISINAVAISKHPGGNMELFAATNGVGIFKSSDYGSTWIPFNNGLTNMYPTDFVVKGPVIYASIYGQGLCATTLTSSSWTTLNSINNIRTISMYDNAGGNMFFMGVDDGNGVYRSPNGISTSNFVNGMINTNITSVASIYDGSGTSILFSGYIGDGGKIMRSDNYGSNWISSTDFSNLTTIRSFPHNTFGTMLIAGGIDGQSRLSSDSGATWNMSVLPGLWSLAYAPITTGGYKVFAATGAGISQSVDNGSTWTPINSGLGTIVIRSVCVSDTNLFVATDIGIYTRSVNGGLWTYASNGINNQEIYELASQGIHLFAANDNGDIFYSTDNGLSWTLSSIGVTGVYSTEFMFYGTTLFAATNQGVFYTNDYGINWIPFNTGFPIPEASSLTVIDSFLVAGTRLFGVWIRPLSQILTGIDSETECNNDDCYQLKIYPNPFQNSTSIKFTIRETGFINAEIFDLQGQKVNDLVSETLVPGEYNYSWDADRLSQGVYFIRITSASQTQTRRLVKFQIP